MKIARPGVLTARGYSYSPPPVSSCNTQEEAALKIWEADIVRASRACVRKRGLAFSHVLADDIAQDVRLSLLLSVRKTGITDERYVRRVIRNSTKNSIRQSRVVIREASDEFLKGIPEEPVARDVFAERRVRRWLGRQPDRFQAVFHLLYRKELSQREAAEHLGVSQPRVAKLHRQLIERAKKELGALAP